MKSKVKYVTQYIDSNGHKHTAVHVYNTVTGFIDMMRDVKDSDYIYPMTDLTKYSCKHT